MADVICFIYVIEFFHFHARFFSEEDRGDSNPRRTRNTARFQQPVVDLLDPYRDRTKQGLKCHPTKSLVNLCAAFNWL